MSTTRCLSVPDERAHTHVVHQSLLSDEKNHCTGKLSLHFRLAGSRTELDGSTHQGLLRASRPVYRKAYVPYVQIVHLGPGSMDQDFYQQQIVMDDGTTANVGYQSYTKVLPGGHGSKQEVAILARKGSSLWLAPNVVIPYAASHYISRTFIQLDRGARVFLPEILLLGRPKKLLHSQSAEFSRLYTSVNVYREDQLMLRDCIDLGLNTLTRGRIGSGFPVMGTLLVLGEFGGLTEESLHHLCTLQSKDKVQVGITSIKDVGFAFRLLGQSVEALRETIQQIQSFIEKFISNG